MRLKFEEASARILRDFEGKKCWRVGKYLASMVYFDFGRRLVENTSRGTIEIGEAVLSIRDVFWEAFLSNEFLTDSDSIFSDKANRLDANFVGKCLKGLAKERGKIVCSFGGECDLFIDLSNKDGTDLDIVEIRTPGSIFRLSPRGQVFLDAAGT